LNHGITQVSLYKKKKESDVRSRTHQVFVRVELALSLYVVYRTTRILFIPILTHQSVRLTRDRTHAVSLSPAAFGPSSGLLRDAATESNAACCPMLCGETRLARRWRGGGVV